MDSAPRFPTGRHRPFSSLKMAGVTAVRRLALGAVGAMVLATALSAGEPTPSPSRLESWLEGPTLTGNWWGVRDDLAASGVRLDLGFTQFYQGPVAGDGDHNWKYGGKPELILDFDFGKLGLWNGFGAVVHGEYNYGRTPAGAGGTILPTNTAMTFPSKNEDGGDLTSVFLRQRFGRLGLLSVGKINMIDAYASGREFSGGRGIDTFQHLEFVAPASGIVPPAIFGAIGTVILPPAAVTLMVYDPTNALTRSPFEDLFEDGVTLNASVQVGTRWFQRSGKHIFTGTWSSRDGVDLGDLPEIFLPPGSADVLSTTKNRWYVSYAFEQTLWRSERDPQRAVGFFGQVALSDGNPNPARWSALGGLSGTSPILGRGGDRFGVAAFYLGVSDDLKDGLRGDHLGDEYGGEVIYNLAVTPWFRVTGDLQVISPALSDSPVVLLGLRAQLKF